MCNIVIYLYFVVYQMGLRQKVNIISTESTKTVEKAKSSNNNSRLFDVKTAIAAFLIAGTLASCWNDYESPETAKLSSEMEVAEKKLKLAKEADEAKEDWEEAKKELLEAEETAEKKTINYEDAIKKRDEYLGSH